ncbi:MAG: tRNA (guanosine(46)-N7)-methyltransferase TrmB [Prevotellaceae bacterium]|nr:tRNA (guanosine(46)-N7)-methyltransferase TrmB [Prevotellaceae bacterium]
MGKGKLAKFADIAANPLVVECGYRPSPSPEPFALKGRWCESFFHNTGQLVLELGCGRGEYTVGLARLHPENNYIGVDIKGARMWTGAEEALREGMRNVGFLRTNIDFIQHFFAPREVSEIWLTFCDPQMKKATKRLTSSFFLERYRRFLAPLGLVHLKTDSPFLFTYTKEMLRANGIEAQVFHDLYADQSEATREARSIQTHYERMWLDEGIAIKYLRFRLPHEGALEEPDVEIPLDEYRSYKRAKRSGSATGK